MVVKKKYGTFLKQVVGRVAKGYSMLQWVLDGKVCRN